MHGQSDQINELLTAFVAAKKEFTPLVKDKQGQRHSYTSKEAIMDSVEQPLLNNGLIFMQRRDFIDGQVVLITTLFHQTSGQYISARMPLYISENAPSIDQAYGAATTYQSRYEMYIMLNVGNDDGNDPDAQSHHQSKQAASDKQLYLLNKLLSEQKTVTKAMVLAKYGVEELESLSSTQASEAIEKIKSLQVKG